MNIKKDNFDILRVLNCSGNLDSLYTGLNEAINNGGVEFDYTTLLTLNHKAKSLTNSSATYTPIRLVGFDVSTKLYKAICKEGYFSYFKHDYIKHLLKD